MCVCVCVCVRARVCVCVFDACVCVYVCVQAKEDLDRYLHYYQRFHTHAQSRLFAQKQRDAVETRMMALQYVLVCLFGCCVCVRMCVYV